MDSTPPAMKMSPWFASIIRAAMLIASRPRCAQPIDRRTWYGRWESCEQARHACDIAVVFAGLIRRTEVHLVDDARVNLRSLNDGPDHMGSEIVGADRRERPAVSSDRGTQGTNDSGSSLHGGYCSAEC